MPLPSPAAAATARAPSRRRRGRMPRWRPLASTLAALGLCACDLTPAYRRPDVDAPAQWREPAPAAASVAEHWWRGFGSVELDTLVERADAQNFDLAAAIARVEQADAQARISGASLLPSVEASGRLERTRQTVPMPQVYTDHLLAAQASYEVDFWGKNRSAYGAARETAIAVAFDREVVRVTTESSVANTYFQYLGLETRIATARENLATAQKLLDGLRKEFAAGTITRVDVVQQETVVASLTADVPPLAQQASQTLDALAILVGEPPERLALAARSLDGIAAPEVAPGLPSELLRRRPDVRAREAELIAANYDIGNARAQFFPDVVLTAEGGVESKQLSQLFTPHGLMYDLIASIAQPIFEGGKLNAQLDYANAKYREQLANYRKAVVAAFGDVEDGLAAVARTRETLRQRGIALDAARTALRLVRRQFEAGTANVVQVLQVEQTLFSQEDAHAQARQAELQAVVALVKALGGGWSDRAGPPPPDSANAGRAS